MIASSPYIFLALATALIEPVLAKGSSGGHGGGRGYGGGGGSHGPVDKTTIIIVCSVLGGVLVISIALWYWLYKRKQREALKGQPDLEATTAEPGTSGKTMGESPWNNELPAADAPAYEKSTFPIPHPGAQTDGTNNEGRVGLITVKLASTVPDMLPTAKPLVSST